MKTKQWNVKIPVVVLEDFHKLVMHFGNKKEQWVVATAALTMFLSAHPDVQKAAVKSVRDKQIDDAFDAAHARDRPSASTRRASAG